MHSFFFFFQIVQIEIIIKKTIISKTYTFRLPSATQSSRFAHSGLEGNRVSDKSYIQEFFTIKSWWLFIVVYFFRPPKQFQKLSPVLICALSFNRQFSRWFIFIFYFLIATLLHRKVIWKIWCTLRRAFKPFLWIIFDYQSITMWSEIRNQKYLERFNVY